MSEDSRPEELELKTSPIELKEDGEKRYMEAVFSLYDEIDSDNDITLPGALKSGYSNNKIPLVWNHDWSKPVGRGVLESSSNKAVFRGYFLPTSAGREAYETVKAMEDMQQFSYGFQVLESENGTITDEKGEEKPVRYLKNVKVWEVSPVLVGAQQNTFVQTLKSGLEQIDSKEEKNESDNSEETMSSQVDEQTQEAIADSQEDLESNDSDTKVSTGKRLNDHAFDSLTELKVFIERIEELALLRHSEKKTLSSNATEIVSAYLAGINLVYNKLDDILAQYGDDEVANNELFIEVQKTLLNTL
jgi:HK97 family phage prohead protease